MADENTHISSRLAAVEVSLGRMDERLKSIDAKEDEHHKALVGKIEDLTNNYAARLDRLETQKFSSVDFIQFRNQEFVPFQNDVNSFKEVMNKALTKLMWYLALAIGGGGTLITLINWWLIYRK